MDIQFYYTFIYIWTGLAVIVFFVLLFMPAPYGRFVRPRWGTMINNRLGWIIMETPSLLTFAWFVFTGAAPMNAYIWFFSALWLIHYIHRSFIFPFRIRSGNKKVPLTIPAMVIVFNAVNGSINGYYLGNLYMVNNGYSISDPQLLMGIALFFFGMGVNLHSDYKLMSLRKYNSNGYVIPRGGFFKWVSCPNYFGEIVEWLGFALMVNSLPAFSFFIWTFANLVPRALDNHRWYKVHFEDYPEDRKAVFPYLL